MKSTVWPSRSHCDHDQAWLSFCVRFQRIWRWFSKFPECFSYAALFLNLPLTIRWVSAYCSGEKVRCKLKKVMTNWSSRLLFLRTTWTTLFDSGMYMYDRQTSSEPERCSIFPIFLFLKLTATEWRLFICLRHGPEIYWSVRIPRSGRHDKAGWQDCPSGSD